MAKKQTNEKEYTNDDLQRLYDKSYFKKRYEVEKKWYVKAEFIKKNFRQRKS